MSYDCGHDQQLVGVAGVQDQLRWVDVMIAPVVRACWRVGIDVFWACDGGTPAEPWAELNFEDEVGVQAFLNGALPVDEGEGSLYDIALGEGSLRAANRERRWHLTVRSFPEGLSHHLVYQLRIPPPDLEWLAHVSPEPPAASRSGSIMPSRPRRDREWTKGFDLASAVAEQPDRDDQPTGKGELLDRLLAAAAGSERRRDVSGWPDRQAG